MIKIRFLIWAILFFASFSFAETIAVQAASGQANGYQIYKENCLQCHDMQIIAPRHFVQKNMEADLLISPPHDNKGVDLSLIYKQKEYSADWLWLYINNFSEHPHITDAPLPSLTSQDAKDLFHFIDWANNPHKVTAIRLGILSFIYLAILLIFWSLWAFKLQRRVVRRYDRYDVPSFPKNAPENLTKASNDP